MRFRQQSPHPQTQLRPAVSLPPHPQVPYISTRLGPVFQQPGTTLSIFAMPRPSQPYLYTCAQWRMRCQMSAICSQPGTCLTPQLSLCPENFILTELAVRLRHWQFRPQAPPALQGTITITFHQVAHRFQPLPRSLQYWPPHVADNPADQDLARRVELCDCCVCVCFGYAAPTLYKVLLDRPRSWSLC